METKYPVLNVGIHRIVNQLSPLTLSKSPPSPLRNLRFWVMEPKYSIFKKHPDGMFESVTDVETAKERLAQLAAHFPGDNKLFCQETRQVVAIEHTEPAHSSDQAALEKWITELRETAAGTRGEGTKRVGEPGKGARFLRKLCGCLSRMKERDRELLLGFAENIVRR